MTPLQTRLRDTADLCHARNINPDWARLATEAADRIDELEAHNMALLADVKDCQQQSRDYQAENYVIKSQMLEAQGAAMAKDAARYRWLRRTQMELGLPAPTVAMLVGDVTELDAAIEAEVRNAST
jgi:hypothetical protein